MNLLEPDLAYECWICFDHALVPSIHYEKLLDADHETRGKIALGIIRCGIEFARRFGVGISVTDAAGRRIQLVEEA